MKFLANENIPSATVNELRNNGFDIKSVYEDNRGISDIEVLKSATQENRIVITFDKDYGELIFQKKIAFKEGVIFLRFIPQYPKEAAEILYNIIETLSLDFNKKFTVIDREKIRQRDL